MQMFWYLRIDGTVLYVADKPFNGTSAPTARRASTPTEALAWLARDVLWVPGHVRHGFSKGWKFLIAKDENGSAELLSIAGLSDPEVVGLMTTFTREADHLLGVRVDCGDVPREHHDALVELLKALINEARAPDDAAS